MGSIPPRAFIKFDEKIFSHLPESLWCGLSYQAAELIHFTIRKNGEFVKRRLFAGPFGINFTRSGFKTSDHVREQGVPRIENGAYTSVREYFNSRDNAAIGH
jgi:hypothetical protein